MSINNNNNSKINNIASINGYHKFNLLAKNLKTNSNPKTIQSVLDALNSMETSSIGTKFETDIKQLKTELQAFKEVIEKGESIQNVEGKLKTFQQTVETVYKTAMSHISKTVSEGNGVSQPSTVTSSSNVYEMSMNTFFNELHDQHIKSMEKLLHTYPATCFSLLDMFKSIRNGKYGKEAQAALEESSVVYYDLPTVLKLTMIHYCYTTNEFSVPDIVPIIKRDDFEKFFKIIINFKMEDVFKLISGDNIPLDKKQKGTSKEEIADDEGVMLLNKLVSYIMSSLENEGDRQMQTALVKMPFLIKSPDMESSDMKTKHPIFAFLIMTIQGNIERAEEFLSHLPTEIHQKALMDGIDILLSLKNYEKACFTIRQISNRDLKITLFDYFFVRLLDTQSIDQLPWALGSINDLCINYDTCSAIEYRCLINCRKKANEYFIDCFQRGDFAQGAHLLSKLPHLLGPQDMLLDQIRIKIGSNKKLSINKIDELLEMLRVIHAKIGNAKDLHSAAEFIVSNAIADSIDANEQTSFLIILGKIPNQSIRAQAQSKFKEMLLDQIRIKIGSNKKLSINKIDELLEMLRVIKTQIGNAKDLHSAAEFIVSNAIADSIDANEQTSSLIILGQIPDQSIRVKAQSKFKEMLLLKRDEIDQTLRKIEEAEHGKSQMEAKSESQPLPIFTLEDLVQIPNLSISPEKMVLALQMSIDRLGPDIRNKIYGSVYQEWYQVFPSYLRIDLDKDHNFGFNACYTVSEQVSGFPKLVGAVKKFLDNR